MHTNRIILDFRTGFLEGIHGPLSGFWALMVAVSVKFGKTALSSRSGDVVRIAPNELVFMRPQAQAGT